MNSFLAYAIESHPYLSLILVALSGWITGAIAYTFTHDPWDNSHMHSSECNVLVKYSSGYTELVLCTNEEQQVSVCETVNNWEIPGGGDSGTLVLNPTLREREQAASTLTYHHWIAE